MHSSPNIGGITKAALRGTCVTRRMLINKSEREYKKKYRKICLKEPENKNTDSETADSKKQQRPSRS